MKITNVDVFLSSEYSDYVMSCVCDDARYHIWLDRKTRQLVTCSSVPILYKNSIPKHGEPGHFDTRRLRFDSKFSAQIVAAMFAQAAAAKLFDKAEKRLADEQADANAKRKSARAEQLAKDAGPEMLTVLQAIQDFWDDGGDFPRELSPYALLLSDDEQLRFAVTRVVRLAKVGK